MASVTLKKITAGPITTGLDLSIRDREFVVLAGPPGSGTSTIIRVIAGLDDSSQGEIFFDDRRVDGVAPKDRDLALVARDYIPYPRLSVFENIAIGLRRRNFGDAEIKKRIAAVAVELDLDAHLEANAESLPQELQRLVGLARALARQPKFYLFDDPFGGLEQDAARRGRAEVAKLHQRSSATIIYTTTLASDALAFESRTIVMTNGGVQQDDLARNIYDAPASLAVAEFFGDPPMNLVRGTVKLERNTPVFSEAGDGTILIPLAPDRHPGASDFLGKPVILGFRPEDVRVDGSAGSGKEAGASFRVLIERAESGGAATDLRLQTGAHALSARVLGTAQAQGGQRVQVAVSADKMHLFDPETGRRVTPKL
jgi:multiple sugar transport system ATP-binding protein